MRLRAIAVLWLWSIVLTAVLTWWITGHRPPPEEVAPDEGHGAAQEVQAGSARRDERSSQDESARDVAALERENVALRGETKRLRAELDRAEDGRLRLVFAQALREMMEAPPNGDDVETTWRKRIEVFRQKEKRGTFEGLDEAMSLMAEMARFGMPGIQLLASVASDHQRETDERELALQVLAHIRDKAALATLLKLREPDIMELDFPYDLIELQISALPTGEIREFIPEINRQIAAELGTDTIAPERTEVLAILALVHGDSRSWSLLQDRRVLLEDLRGAVRIAADVHTHRARQFVEWVARDHPRDDVSEAASRLVDNW